MILSIQSNCISNIQCRKKRRKLYELYENNQFLHFTHRHAHTQVIIAMKLTNIKDRFGGVMPYENVRLLGLYLENWLLVLFKLQLVYLVQYIILNFVIRDIFLLTHLLY